MSPRNVQDPGDIVFRTLNLSMGLEDGSALTVDPRQLSKSLDGERRGSVQSPVGTRCVSVTPCNNCCVSRCYENEESSFTENKKGV